MKLDVEQLIRLGLLKPEDEKVVYTGSIESSNGDISAYRVTNGWDVLSAHQCDTEWKAYRFKLAEYLEQTFVGGDLEKALASIPVEDAHWRWLDKSCCYHSQEYQWFFLKTDSGIEAACLTYHPKASELADENIFYIEFIAVSPWNRDDPMQGKVFKSIGSLLMRVVINYSVEELGQTYGFSLHSLPQANGFYKKIGMVHCKSADKDCLEYFEMDEENSRKFVSALC